MDQAARETTSPKHLPSSSGWERVHHSDTAGYDATEVLILVWRLPVPGGWIYKATEREKTEDHRSVSICFVPKVTRVAPKIQAAPPVFIFRAPIPPARLCLNKRLDPPLSNSGPELITNRCMRANSD